MKNKDSDDFDLTNWHSSFTMSTKDEKTCFSFIGSYHFSWDL